MKEEHPTDTLPLTTTNSKTKRETSEGVAVGKGHCKFWLLAAIILLSLWSIFTASLSLKWSAPNLTRHFHSTTLHDLDVLEVEEREKVVRRMWDVYSHSTTTRLPRFWYDAFHAAYEHLVSDVPGVRDAAVSEIVKMSLRSLNLHPFPLHLKSDSVHHEHLKKKRRKHALYSIISSWKILNGTSQYNVKTYIDIIMAAFALHNYIRINSEDDRIFTILDQYQDYIPCNELPDINDIDTINENMHNHFIGTYERSIEMKKIRNNIANLLWNAY